jgi:hypothetical protein
MPSADSRDRRTLTAKQVEELLATAATPRPAADAAAHDAARIRDRYIAIRFEGIARSSADLADAARVIKSARLEFEEGSPETALELLELAIEQNYREPSLWLAELEIAFLMRDGPHFTETAREFREAHPDSDKWEEINRLGHALMPEEALFRESERRANAHYGPWPDLPNWIGAPWDLTAEVQAADFHMALTRETSEP